MSSTIPASTYRLHLTGEFTLHDAAALVGHIDQLGVDWVYASPIQTVPPGATHGYHILDPDRINPELGGEEGLDRLRAAIDRHERGLVLDIVPNHLGASVDNPWWRDVLTHGPASAYATFFDIDFDAGRVVLPVLGESVEQAISGGAVRLTDDEPAQLDVHGTRYPLAPDTDTEAVLAEVLAQQHYELTPWREGEARLNWRRFFAVNELAGVRVEDPAVFDAVHRRLFALKEQGTVDGFRVDHVDGLRLPGPYLTDLRHHIGDDTWLVVEKIVEVTTPDGGLETIPTEWPVNGTTGYETGALIQAWLTDTTGHQQLRADFTADTGLPSSAQAALADSKMAVLEELFGAEVDRVVAALRRAAEDDPDGRQGPDDGGLADGVRQLAAHLDGYRTYAPATGPLSSRDTTAISRAAGRAGTDHAREVARRLQQPAGRSALLRWQQLTGPAAAKGFEDRLMFQHVALASLAEVGADAAYLDGPPDAAASGRLLVEQADRSPLAGVTTSTHDTKRSEDVRARLLVLAEVPQRYRDTLLAVSDALGDAPHVDGHARWLVLQAVIGTLGLSDGRSAPEPEQAYRERLAAWTTKALREADLRTGHRDPDQSYETGVLAWLDQLLSPGPALSALQHLIGRIEVAGATNSLATVLLKIIAPGVPDIYRGCETWDDSLTDPDNRRPLRVERLRQTMDSLTDTSAEALRHRWRDGAVKMHVTRVGLRTRRDLRGVFLGGTANLPAVTGTHAEHVCAMGRTDPDSGACVVAVAPRRPFRLAAGGWAVGEVWEDTAVAAPAGSSDGPVELFSGRPIAVADGRIRLSDALRDLPVALLRL